MRVLLAILLATAAPAMKHTGADTKLAQASLVKAADFGNGWTGKSSPQEGATFGCNGFQPNGAGIVETGAATSPSITYDTTGPFILQKTSVYATAGEAKTYWQRAVTPGLVTCAVQTLQAVEARGVKVAITSQGKLPFSTSLPQTSAYRVVGRLTSANNKVTNYFDVIILGEGRAITVITVSSFKAAPPAAFERALARLVITRLAGPGAA